nr:retrovirus-related Pol polyprotein from transposon TNT 1-94 [Tanacetum cinerariifolium]
MKSLRKSTDLTANTPYYSRLIRCIQDFDESKDHFLTLKNTPYPHQRYAVYNTLVKEEQDGFTQYAVSIKKIRHIRAYTSLDTMKNSSSIRRIQDPQYAVYKVKMDDLNITMEECIRLEEETSQNMGKRLTGKLLRMNRGQGMNPWGGGEAGYGGVQNRVGNANPGQARQVKCYNCNGTGHIARNCTQPKRPHNSEYYKDKMLLMQAQENGADDYDAFDFDMDEAPMVQTMFMANLSSADPITDEAGPSYDSDILSEYVKDNEVLVVHSNVSSVPNDAYMMIYNDMYEPHAQSVSNTSWNAVVENSLTAELATYKEQVKLHPTFLEFDKTCQKRITPTGLTEGERGFEQTKECYLKEVFLFFKTLKDNFEGIQKALTKEIKEMKNVFEELEEEVAQNVIDRKHDAIERKNLVIANDNLIVECLSIEVFSVATNFELNVARFTEMNIAQTIVEARCLELKLSLLIYVTRVTMIIKKS